MRELRDPRAMRALAHPLRISLLEALGREGPMTATQAADLLGDSPGNMSFHLRTLAKYGFVEEAAGRRGRSRPWRLVALGMTFSTDPADLERSLAAGMLSDQFLTLSIDRLRGWHAHQHAYAKEWREAGFQNSSFSYLAAAELAQLGREVHELFSRYRDRALNPAHRPAGTQPVQLVAFGHPIPANPSGN